VETGIGIWWWHQNSKWSMTLSAVEGLKRSRPLPALVNLTLYFIVLKLRFHMAILPELDPYLRIIIVPFPSDIHLPTVCN